jgi:glutamate-5-semialdehyde dehydrogenase
MNSPASLSLAEYCQQVARQAKQASQLLLQVDSEAKNRWLCAVADDLQSASGEIAAANQRDVDAAKQAGLTAAQIDRLSLNHQRIKGIASGLNQVAALADPVGEIIEQTLRPNGIQINKLRVPLGVIFFIYESRPNVTADAAAICVKSGNAVILRGGKEAAHSNKLIADKLRGRLREFGLPLNAVQLVGTTERD